LGVGKKVIIHMPERSVCLSDEGYSCLGSYILPDGYIQGTTGAGDAFCAGALIGIYNGWADMQIMEFASACAVMTLGSTDATSGMKTEDEIIEFCKQFTRREVT
jgi:sugar/nucleoside kinase (ribokinase family)